MVDPLSIAGLTFAVFDQLLKLSERTIQFVSEARSFDENVRLLEHKIKDEHNRSEQLKTLLFTPTPLYNHNAMFDHFSEDVQDQIKILLVEAVGKLHEAVDLLDKRYSRHAHDACLSSSGNVFDRMRQSSRSPLRVVQWSFRDKKRTEAIVTEFTELNRRIHENIKLFILGSSLSVNPERHLRHLQSSPASQQLGFNIDATLRLHAENAEQTVENCGLPQEPWERILLAANPVRGYEQRYAITNDADVPGSSLILEYRRYEAVGSQTGQEVDDRTRNLLNWLARLLKESKEEYFLVPRCRGWRYIPNQEKIAFVFETPLGFSGVPISLLDLLRDSRAKLSLNERLQIAFGLARSLSHLQMVQWVHESIRSESILFFPASSETDPNENHINYAQPWVFGFEFSRPETFISHGLTDVSIERDVYRHPDRQGRPSVKFQKIHDIYALGVVLLEIGLWESWDQMQKVRAAYQHGARSLQSLLIQHAQRWLSRRMGDKYRDIVIKCLGGHFVMAEDTREELNLQQAFRAEVVDMLERSLASI